MTLEIFIAKNTNEIETLFRSEYVVYIARLL